MSNMVTRCPKCATSFRITSAQLQSAKGAVRCGSCLHIFKAQDHLISGTPQPAVAKPAPASNATKPSPRPSEPRPLEPRSAEPNRVEPKPLESRSAAGQPSERTPLQPATASTRAAPPKPSSPAPQPAETVAATPSKAATPVQPATKPAEENFAFNQEDINRELTLNSDDDFLISDDMDEPDEQDQSDYEFDGFLDIKNLPKQGGSLFDREIRQKEPEKDDIDPDESWAMELLDEADEETRLSSIRNPRKEEVEDEGFSADERLSDTDLDDDQPGQQETPQASAIPFKGPVFNIVAEKNEASDESEEIHAQSYNDDDQHYQHAMSDNGREDSRLRAFDNSRAALLMNIMPEPVEMTARHNRQSATKRLWGGLSVLLVLVLFIQLAWLQFDNLNRTEPYRSFYESVCSVMGCKLPALVDRSKIRAYNLVVRNHPKLENALIVDAILLNNASFQQPFPDLILAFSTIDDTPVASRRFKPHEYLRGELAGKSLMPQNQPVHLTLELVDPGSEAVNYHAYIPE